MKHTLTRIATVLLVSLPLCAGADLKVSGVFGEHMVLQRGKPVPVWGWGEPGEQVTLQFAGQTIADTIDGLGKWQATLEPMPASAEPRTLVIESQATNQQLRITDVLVGDVFVLAGQSNMTW